MVDENSFVIETNAGKLYATKGVLPTNSYIEIGYFDENGKQIPVAAIEVKTKKIHEDIDESAIWRVIYNSPDWDKYDQIIINK